MQRVCLKGGDTELRFAQETQRPNSGGVCVCVGGGIGCVWPKALCRHGGSSRQLFKTTQIKRGDECDFNGKTWTREPCGCKLPGVAAHSTRPCWGTGGRIDNHFIECARLRSVEMASLRLAAPVSFTPTTHCTYAVRRKRVGDGGGVARQRRERRHCNGDILLQASGSSKTYKELSPRQQRRPQKRPGMGDKGKAKRES